MSRPLVVERTRLDLELTGIMVDAVGPNGLVGVWDLAHLDATSVVRWLRENDQAEFLALFLLGHDVAAAHAAIQNADATPSTGGE